MNTIINELKAKLEELENRQWYLSMADRWTVEDSNYNRQLTNEIISIKKQLRELGENI